MIEEIISDTPTTISPPVVEEPEEVEEPEVIRTAAQTARALGEGINLGNMLEAPREGDFGRTLDAQDFVTIAEAGFDHVRLPVSWAEYAAETAPFTIPDGIDPTITHPDYTNIWDRVQWAIDQAEANDLQIIVNTHHYDEAHEDPAGHRDRLIAIWQQIAARYADASDDVVFELFNEPNGEFDAQPEVWNALAADLVDVVRETNPTRKILIGPVGFNHINELDSLVLPNDDNVLATVHLYEPFNFTHQGADWVENIPPLGTSWQGSELGLANGLVDLSFDTTTTGEGGALRVDFSRQWAGFGAGWSGPEQPTEIRFTASGDSPTTVQLGCRTPANDQFDIQQVTLTTEPTEYVVDLSSCSPSTTGFSMQNANPQLVPVRIQDIEVCTQQAGCRQTLISAEDSLRGWLQDAAAWGNANGVPVHLGEFGAFSAGGAVSLSERAAWTDTVADEADRLGIPFSYWEFNAVFGAFDEANQVWIPELRDALLQ